MTRRKIQTSLVCLALALLVGCGGAGGGDASFSTQTGNPPEGEQPLSTPTIPSIYEALFLDLSGLGNVICGLIQDISLDEMPRDRCQSELLSLDGLDVALGLDPTTYHSFGEMLDAQKNGMLVTETDTITTCIFEVMHADHEDPRVVAAYDSRRNKLGDIAGLLTVSVSCQTSTFESTTAPAPADQ